ncbi:DUF4349 domain-containing protein [Halorussus gelatinilyticus]|uniref:DUF4349 domain-containing protein n=1 Tax=Halorussus gelatinilyticus TaxID=2937524 RepID=A0A8U0IH97_9EURY|nr:DUF4349 domain-containing protein [Halorussus gelatinilyticus]UPW00066.1 DUF4349 domain-containing protein [Halorussus gelatinilyticus]
MARDSESGGDARRWALALALVSLVVLAGCSGGGGSDAAMQATSGQNLDVSSDSKATQRASDGGGGGTNAQSDALAAQNRALIRTGTVEVTVESYDEARRTLTRETERLGGFVSDSAQQVNRRDNRTWTNGKLVLRVPKENFSALVERAKATGEVREASTSTKDVTKKLVDIEARLANLKAQREKLRDLYAEANDTENVLEVQKRLSEVQSEIERLQAERKSLRRQVAYSTLTVRLHERPPERNSDPNAAWYDTGLLSAFVSSAGGVVVVARGLAVGAAYALPYLLAFGVPVVGAVALWRRRRAGDSSGADPPDAPESPDGGESGEDDD